MRALHTASKAPGDGSPGGGRGVWELIGRPENKASAIPKKVISRRPEEIFAATEAMTSEKRHQL